MARQVGSILNLGTSHFRSTRYSCPISSNNTSWIIEKGIVGANATRCFLRVASASTIYSSSLLNSSTGVGLLDVQLFDFSTCESVKNLFSACRHSCLVLAQKANILACKLTTAALSDTQILCFQALRIRQTLRLLAHLEQRWASYPRPFKLNKDGWVFAPIDANVAHFACHQGREGAQQRRQQRLFDGSVHGLLLEAKYCTGNFEK